MWRTNPLRGPVQSSATHCGGADESFRGPVKSSATHCGLACFPSTQGNVRRARRFTHINTTRGLRIDPPDIVPPKRVHLHLAPTRAHCCQPLPVLAHQASAPQSASRYLCCPHCTLSHASGSPLISSHHQASRLKPSHLTSVHLMTPNHPVEAHLNALHLLAPHPIPPHSTPSPFSSHATPPLVI